MQSVGYPKKGEEHDGLQPSPKFKENIKFTYEFLQDVKSNDVTCQNQKGPEKYTILVTILFLKNASFREYFHQPWYHYTQIYTYFII